ALVRGLGTRGPRQEPPRHTPRFGGGGARARPPPLPPFRTKFSGLVAEGAIGEERVLALKPQTYMNDSGESVGAAARFYKLAPEDAVVLHDELDLKPGKVRGKRGGGAAGHDGLRTMHRPVA